MVVSPGWELSRASELELRRPGGSHQSAVPLAAAVAVAAPDCLWATSDRRFMLVHVVKAVYLS